MAQDNALRAQRAQGDAGVFERLSLFNGGGLGTDQCRVRAQPLGREFEGGTGAGAGFVEEEGNAPMGQALRARCGLLSFQLRSQAKDVRYIVQLQRGHGEQRP